MVTSYLFLPKNPYPSSITWWPRHIRSRSCVSKNYLSYLWPKTQPHPLSFSSHPLQSSSGSFQRRSATIPLSGTSHGLGIFSIYSIFLISFEIPPCIHMIFSSMTATKGMLLKQLKKDCHSESLYLRLISSKNP